MDWQVPIYDGATQRGKLFAQQEGLRTFFQVDCPKWGDGVHKIWLQGEQGTTLLLGTLVPEGDRLRLERSISNAMLREKGLERCDAAIVRTEGTQAAEQLTEQAQVEESDWCPIQTLERPDWDKGLREAIRGLHGGRWKPVSGGVVVTCPWSVGQPMPCMPMVCFGVWSAKAGGKLTWRLDETGKPKIPVV